MNVNTWIKNLILKWLGFKKVAYDPNAEKFTFINDEDAIRKDELDEYDAWYIGKSSGLLNVYRNKEWYSYYTNPIYNQNKTQFFWALSSLDQGFKRSHCGFPRDYINTMATKIGAPKIWADDDETTKKVNEIGKSNSFGTFVTQDVVPWTLVEGTGCIKPNFSKNVSPHPYFEFYKERDIKMITAGRKIIGCAFMDYYKDDKDKDYTLYEIRHVAYNTEADRYDSIIEYHLMSVDRGGNEGEEVPLSTIKELAGYKDLIIKGLDRPLCTPVVFYPDGDRFGYGVSVYSNKIDIFDNLDEAYSIQQICTRDSTPVYMINPEYCKKDSLGNPTLPSYWNRQFLSIGDIPMNANGTSSGTKPMDITQPDVKVEEYESEITSLKIEALGNFLSPVTMGVGLGLKDNADSQREKEKVTITSREYLISVLVPIIKEVLNDALMLQGYMDSNYKKIDVDKDYGINVQFDTFSSPTLETKANTLTPMLVQGAMSPASFVDAFWGEGKSEDNKAYEVKYIEDFMSKKIDKSNNSNGVSTTPEKPTVSLNNGKNLGSRDNEEKNDGIYPDNASYTKRTKVHSTVQNQPIVNK